MQLFNKTIIALSLITVYSPTFASNNDAFTELDQATTAAKRTQSDKNKEFIDYINQRLDEYEDWRENYTKELDEKRQSLINQWGSAEISDNTTDIEYGSEDTVKKVIDYETNTATISVLVDSSMPKEQIEQLLQNTQLPDGATFDVQSAQVTEETVNYSLQREEQEKSFILAQTQQQMNEYDVQAERLIAANIGVPDDFIYQRAHGKKMALIDEAKNRMSAISKLYQQRRQELGIIVEVKSQSETKTADKPLDLAVKTSAKTQIVEPTAIKQQTDIVSVEKKVELTTTPEKTNETSMVKVEEPEKNITKAEVPKKIISYKINLPNNSLAKRASQYQPMALKESDKWSIDPALVMAIMHSESAFRPDAKSHVPAFGLMQIVPSSAGRDVNKQARNIDAPMKVEDLYNPPVNVETGTVYLHILNSKYLKSIKNDKSRLYCMIAAYNTGAGNVARAFNQDRSTNIRAASKKINEMTPDEVYTHLINNLPYDETKNYLKKVSSRMALYQPEKML